MTRWSCAALLAFAAGAAAAQASVSLSLLSDYRFRGASLSDGNPAPQVGVNLDGDAGWYGGALATGAVRLSERATAQVLAYGGYARRLASGWSWEAGATESVFTQARERDYGELYVGLSGERVNGRLYFAPRYFGYDSRTVYAEINGVYPLRDGLNLTGHAGWLHTLSGEAWPGVPADSRYDARIGLSAPLGEWNVQLAWVLTQRSGEHYLHDDERSPR
uniref:TorF family putative porin n=1 Tax=Rugamonas sp. TaxID=1926287 RepID=UPI0025F20381